MVDASVEASKQFWLDLVNEKMTIKKKELEEAEKFEIVQPSGEFYSFEEAKKIVSDARANLDLQFQEIDARTQRTLRRVCFIIKR